MALEINQYKAPASFYRVQTPLEEHSQDGRLIISADVGVAWNLNLPDLIKQLKCVCIDKSHAFHLAEKACIEREAVIPDR